MKYNKIIKENYEEANCYYYFLSRQINSKEREDEMIKLYELLTDYEMSLYKEQ